MTPEMEITYRTIRSDLWRCYTYSLLRRLISGAFIMICILLVERGFFHYFQHFGRWEFVTLLIVVLISWFAYFALTFRIQIHKKLPTVNTERICTTKLSSDGLRDVTPEKSVVIPWTKIREVRQHQGDIYFWRGIEGGTFVPRTAFQNPQQAQQFFEMAVSLWQAAKTGQPLPEIKEGEVWPPPPSISA